MRILDGLLRLLVYAGVATVAMQLAAAVVLWNKGLFHRSHWDDALAVLYDVQLQLPAPTTSQPASRRPSRSLNEVHEARQAVHLNLDLREMASDNGQDEMLELRRLVQARKATVQQLKQDYDAKLRELEGGQLSTLTEIRSRLEVVAPKQAKEQLIMLLEDPALGEELGLQSVVSLTKAMPLDRRKKILSEFKSDAEVAHLHRILRRMREGRTAIQIVEETQKKLEGIGTIRPEFAP